MVVEYGSFQELLCSIVVSCIKRDISDSKAAQGVDKETVRVTYPHVLDIVPRWDGFVDPL